MKTSVVVTLIVMGTVLLLAPYISGYLYEAQTARLIERSDAGTVYLERGVAGQYTWACLLIGVGMIAAAIRAAISAERMAGLREERSLSD